MKTLAAIYRRVGRAIRDARLKADLTQQQLAALTSIGRTSIVNIESGRQAAQLETIEEIALALHVSVASLVDTPTMKQRVRSSVPGALSEAQLDAIVALMGDE